MLCTCSMHCQLDKSQLYRQDCLPIESSHTLQQFSDSDPVWDPLNASNDSKKAFALQPEKVCTVIAIKECIQQSVQISKVIETWLWTAKTLCSWAVLAPTASGVSFMLRWWREGMTNVGSIAAQNRYLAARKQYQDQAPSFKTKTFNIRSRDQDQVSRTPYLIFYATL